MAGVADHSTLQQRLGGRGSHAGQEVCGRSQARGPVALDGVAGEWPSSSRWSPPACEHEQGAYCTWGPCFETPWQQHGRQAFRAMHVYTACPSAAAQPAYAHTMHGRMPSAAVLCTPRVHTPKQSPSAVHNQAYTLCISRAAVAVSAATPTPLTHTTHPPTHPPHATTHHVLPPAGPQDQPLQQHAPPSRHRGGHPTRGQGGGGGPSSLHTQESLLWLWWVTGRGDPPSLSSPQPVPTQPRQSSTPRSAIECMMHVVWYAPPVATTGTPFSPPAAPLPPLSPHQNGLPLQ
jgi:hypothetical protein